MVKVNILSCKVFVLKFVDKGIISLGLLFWICILKFYLKNWLKNKNV